MDKEKTKLETFYIHFFFVNFTFLRIMMSYLLSNRLSYSTKWNNIVTKIYQYEVPKLVTCFTIRAKHTYHSLTHAQT